MPCGGCDDGGVRDRAERQIIENLLCELLTRLEYNGVIMDYVHEGAPLAQWWAAHKEQDRRRASMEAAKEQSKALRREALAKLTEAEREALGIRKER